MAIECHQLLTGVLLGLLSMYLESDALHGTIDPSVNTILFQAMGYPIVSHQQVS